MNAEKDILLARLNGLILARPLFFVPILGLFLLLHFQSIQNTPTLSIFYFLIGATGGLTVLSILLLPRIKDAHRLAIAQLVVDIFLITLLVGVTGNVESPFSILYIANIVLSALFFPQRGGLLIAIMAIFLLSGLTLTADPSLPLAWDRLPSATLPRKETFYRLFLHILAFYATGIASSRFFSKMHEKETGFARLRRLNEDIIRNVPSGLVTLDLAGRVTLFNKAASHITDIPPEEAMGRVMWDLFGWNELQVYYHHVMTHGSSQRFEGAFLKKDGESSVLGVTLSSMRNDRDEMIGTIGIFQDLTHIKKMEEEMHHKRRLAAIGEMAAGMAHEIRNPLASISGSVQLLKNELRLNGDHQRLMEIALDETQRLNNIITEFMLYAKPLPPRRRWTNLCDLLAESVELLKRGYRLKPIQIDLIPPPTPITLQVDPDQMKQVFWNLTMNAFQAMPDGGTLTLVPHVLKNPENDENSIEICFSDTGTGIAPENRPKIFDPFFTTKSTGSGLGLAIVQRIVEQHGGGMEVTSTPMGTTFSIRLPQGNPQEQSWPDPPLA